MPATPLTIALLVFAAWGCGPLRSDGSDEEDGGAVVTPTTCTSPSLVNIADRFEVFAYEASRPGANFATSGEGSDFPACSSAGVLPWIQLTWQEASTACQASGFSLCTEEQWLIACGGTSKQRFPYSPSVEKPGTCNDWKAGAGEMVAAGTYDDCVSPDGVYDIIGNVWEWTSGLDNNDRPLRGGWAWKVTGLMPRQEAQCATIGGSDESYASELVGFRCCRAL